MYIQVHKIPYPKPFGPDMFLISEIFRSGGIHMPHKILDLKLVK